MNVRQGSSRGGAAMYRSGELGDAEANSEGSGHGSGGVPNV